MFLFHSTPAFINGEVIQISVNTRNKGVAFNEYLYFDKHINATVSYCWIRNQLIPDIKWQWVNSAVLSHIVRSIVAYFSFLTGMRNLQIIRNASVLFSYGVNYLVTSQIIRL